MNSMREKPVCVRLNEVERDMMQELMEEFGFGNPSEMLRYLLRSKWEELRKLRIEEERIRAKGRSGGGGDG